MAEMVRRCRCPTSQRRASPGHPVWRQKISGKYERDGGTCGDGSTDNRGCKMRDLRSRKSDVGVKVKRRGELKKRRGKLGRMGYLLATEEKTRSDLRGRSWKLRAQETTRL